MQSNSVGLRRRVVFRLILTLVPFVAIVGLFEAGLTIHHVVTARAARALLPPQAERALVPSADPGLRIEFNPGFRDETFSVNAFGMADDEMLEARTPGLTRIAIFGDSISANFTLEPRASIFPTLIEEELNRLAAARGSDQRFETLNFGVNSYSLLESLRMAELRVPRFQPDIVIVQLCLNDSSPSSTDGEAGPPTFWLRSIDFVLRRLDPHRFWAREHVDAHFDKQGWESWSQGFAGFARLAEGRPMLAVLFPYLDPGGYSDWDYGRLHAGIARRARDASVPLLDLRADFEKENLIYRRPGQDPIHPKTEGHRLAAERIVAELVRMRALEVSR